MSKATLAEFMARPVAVSTFTWSTASVANDVITSFDICSLLETTTIWSNKLQGFLNYRGKAVFRIQVNANPFQAGRLLAHFIPFTAHISAETIATRNLNLVLKTQQPNVEIDCRDSSGIIEIPYIAPTGYYDRSLATVDWGKLYISVLSPLVVGSGQTTSAVVTVWLHFEDFELSAPFNPQAGSGGKRSRAIKSRNPSDVEQTTGPISSTLSMVASVADSLSDVPVISEIAKPVAWVADAVGGLASFFGFAKPRVEVPGQQVVLRNAGTMTTFDGVTQAAPLSLSARNKVEQMPGFAGSDLDEMSFNYLKSIPAYFANFSLSTSDSTGDSKWNFDIYPLGINKQSTVTVAGSPTDTYTYYSFPAFVYLANLFTLYRGAIVLTFKFVKTQFHTGRILISYVPIPSPGTPPTTANSSYLLREVVDLRESQEISLTFPYLKGQDYFSTASAYGSVYVTVLNPIRAPTTCAQTVDVLVYAHAASDFELQGPRDTDKLGTVNAINYPFVPQAGAEESGVLIQKPVGDAPSVSLDVDHSRYTIGEHFSSIKQLLCKYTRLLSATNIQGTGTLWPWSIGLSRLATTTNQTNPRVGAYGGDAYCFLAPGYALARGGMNIMTTGTFGGQGLACLVRTDSAAEPNTFSFISTSVASAIDNLSTAANYANYANLAPIQSFNSMGQALEVFVPSYARTPSRLLTWNIDTTSTYIPADISQPTTSISWNIDTATKQAWFRACSDDVQLGYFLGFPPILKSITSA